MYTIEEAKNSLIDGIKIYLQKKPTGDYVMQEVNRLPFYLEGSPGIGKTEIVSQIADEMGIGFVSFSLTHHTRNSLLGLPVIKDLEYGKYTEYTMSEIIAKVLEAKENGHNEGILLLDEFSCVSDSIMPAMLAFLQTKNIGTHCLPEGWVIVLCGNPPEYNRSAKRFDAAILDRIRKISIQFDSGVFLAYAQKNEFHPTICSFLKMNPQHVYHCEYVNKEPILVTCRGWENLSHALYGTELLGKSAEHNMVKQFIKSDDVVYEFVKFYNLNQLGITEKEIENILSGKDHARYFEAYADKDYSVWWNMLGVIVDYMKTKHQSLSKYVEKRNLAEDIIDELMKSQDIYNQIKRRNGENCYCDSTIERWERGSNNYVDITELEKELLDEWMCEFDEINEYEWGGWDNCTDETVRQVLQTHLKKMKKEMPYKWEKLSKEIGNVIRFMKMKDEVLLEKFYQEINHTDIFLQAMINVKNQDYIDICKKNYAVGA